MANRKKPTNKELLDMCIYLREQVEYLKKLSQDTAYVVKTYISMKQEDEALFRELRKNTEQEQKNKSIIENVTKGVNNGKAETDQAIIR